MHVVTGAAGFVGTNLIGRLLERGHSVMALDDLSRGLQVYVDRHAAHPAFHFRKTDCALGGPLHAAFEAAAAIEPVTDVWHMAANSDIPAGVADPRIDFRNTFSTTFEILLAMAAHKVKRLHFASSSAIYGDFKGSRVAEGSAPYRPISNYGAMKLASEAQISAAVEAFLDQGNIFRFPNVVGAPATHGVIYDFIAKLARDPGRLDVLGNGTQQKAYLHVDDLVDAMLFIADHGPDRLNILNIGPTDDGVTVRFIAETVRDTVAPGAELVFGQGDRGWVGDVPKFRYDVEALARLGWTPDCDSAEAVRRAVRDILADGAQP